MNRKRVKEVNTEAEEERNQRKRDSTPGVTLKRVNNDTPTRNSPQRGRQRSDSDKTPFKRQRSSSRETFCKSSAEHE